MKKFRRFFAKKPKSSSLPPKLSALSYSEGDLYDIYSDGGVYRDINQSISNPSSHSSETTSSGSDIHYVNAADHAHNTYELARIKPSFSKGENTSSNKHRDENMYDTISWKMYQAEEGDAPVSENSMARPQNPRMSPVYEQDKVKQEATSGAEYANHRTTKNAENRVSRGYLELDMDDTESPPVPPKSFFKLNKDFHSLPADIQRGVFKDDTDIEYHDGQSLRDRNADDHQTLWLPPARQQMLRPPPARQQTLWPPPVRHTGTRPLQKSASLPAIQDWEETEQYETDFRLQPIQEEAYPHSHTHAPGPPLVRRKHQPGSTGSNTTKRDSEASDKTFQSDSGIGECNGRTDSSTMSSGGGKQGHVTSTPDGNVGQASSLHLQTRGATPSSLEESPPRRSPPQWPLPEESLPEGRFPEGSPLEWQRQVGMFPPRGQQFTSSIGSTKTASSFSFHNRNRGHTNSEHRRPFSSATDITEDSGYLSSLHPSSGRQPHSNINRNGYLHNNIVQTRMPLDDITTSQSHGICFHGCTISTINIYDSPVKHPNSAQRKTFKTPVNFNEEFL